MFIISLSKGIGPAASPILKHIPFTIPDINPIHVAYIINRFLLKVIILSILYVILIKIGYKNVKIKMLDDLNTPIVNKLINKIKHEKIKIKISGGILNRSFIKRESPFIPPDTIFEDFINKLKLMDDINRHIIYIIYFFIILMLSSPYINIFLFSNFVLKKYLYLRLILYLRCLSHS